ncbi:reverse transcriptase domain-containing protein [Mammaliicoccus sciuri]|uniref:reverse transcriptase domain-containing protein n=1 Tax=Sporosarcina sp. FSL K6-3508 TaxID=2921557 RepID=UPI003159FDE8
MQPKLVKDIDTLKFLFKNLKSFDDVACLLEVEKKTLWENVIAHKRYFDFEIPKKRSNEVRTINKPAKNLDIIQKKFNYILSNVYGKPSKPVHGFTPDRSIKTNASTHLKKNLILNIDLSDFFGSINFPRVRAMFMSYFRFNNEVATILANIVCDNNNALPQGGATSPIISNIISFKLDKQLSKLARNSGCLYTRYADDITFSTNRHEFSNDIFNSEEDIWDVSEKVKSIINKNGFQININKTRISNQTNSMYVTGIKVNEKLNVKRTYVRRIRSILHSIEKNIDNIPYARNLFSEKYRRRHTFFSDYDMFNILRGLISHIGFVKGKQDGIYQKFAKRYNDIVKTLNENGSKNYPYIYRPLTSKEFRQRNVYVVEEDIVNYILGDRIAKTLESKQGSAFLLKGYGLITNWHVVSPYIDNVLNNELAKFNSEYYIPISRSKYSDEISFAKILAYDKSRDLAVLEVDSINVENSGFNFNLNISENMPCVLLGYPEYIQGQILHEVEGKIQSQRIARYYPEEFIRYTTTMSILGGNSGGPIVNFNNEVIAVAVKGSNNTVSEVIPIAELLLLIEKSIS